MLDLCHLSDQSGNFNEFFFGISAGNNDVLVFGLVFQGIEDIREVEIIVAQHNVELVKEHNLDVGILN